MTLSLAQQCALPNVVPVEGEPIADPDGCDATNCPGESEEMVLTDGDILCNGTTPIAPSGFDSSKKYFRGPFPFSGPAGVYEHLLYCGGGALTFAVLDENDCVVDSGPVTNWDCETLSGYYDTTDAFGLGCCDGGPGADLERFRVHINGG